MSDMDSVRDGRDRYRRLSLWPWLFAALVWTALIAAGAAAYLWEEEKQVENYALFQARAGVDKDLLYRRWASGHGGVYVVPTEKSPPNPWLAFLPDRDVVTTEGKKLTLINPAYMTRQVHELGAEEYGTKGHITSLKPIRPENAPDDWERRVLGEFEGGAKEKWEMTPFSGEPYLRYMRVLYAEKKCLTCHARQGYEEGEVRGGLSTSVPLRDIIAASEQEKRIFYFFMAAIWAIGLGAIFVMRRSVVMGTSALQSSLSANVRAKVRYRSLFEHMLDGYAVCELVVGPEGEPEDYRYVDLNPAFESVFGKTADELVGAAAGDVGGRPPPFLERFAEVLRTGIPAQFDEFIPSLGKHLELFAYRTGERDFAFVVRDLTRRKKAEAEREHLSAQLIQAQKMEAIGKLAGGVAHDFNNMLGVIRGNAELALLEFPEGDSRREFIEEIATAATRSSEITRQLLAFARKQTAAPKVLQPNDALEAMLKMIRRLIGEDINLLWRPGREVWRVRIDPSQLDQIMANLATNARDAIAGVGKLTIETSNATIDRGYVEAHQGFLEGRYAVLAVSDDGCGIEREKLDSIFEPFFTSKEKGKGTGLGLATVYGIVKQNGGFINVYSEPGSGATFHIYLPAVDEEAAVAENVEEALVHGTETVLLVEDEPAILKLTGKYLRTLGYNVLSAGSVEASLELAREHRGRIGLLMTDVVMPGMNGRELYGKVRELVPEVKCLFMSGYTANVIAHRGVLDEGVNFIGKPFGIGELSRKLRSALNS